MSYVRKSRVINGPKRVQYAWIPYPKDDFRNLRDWALVIDEFFVAVWKPLE